MHMSKENIIIGAIALLVLVTLGWYLFSQGPGVQAPGTTATTTQSADTSGAAADVAAPAGKGTGPLQNVFTRGGNYTCTFATASTAAGTGAKSSGTIYVAAGKTRGDFSVLSNAGVRTTVHIIRNSSTNYTWIDGQTSGTKTAITATTATRINPSGAGFTEDQFASVSWDCHAWLTDATQFVPPASITFVLK